MKKPILLFLSCLIALNAFGYNLILSLLIYDAKSEMRDKIEDNRESIPEEKLVMFNQETDKFVRISRDEIIFNNEMFDIVSEKRIGNKVYIYCVKDEKETGLNIAFFTKEKNKDRHNQPGNRSNLILKNLVKYYLPDSSCLPKNNKNIFINNTVIISFSPVVFIPVFSPPPEMLFSC